MAWQRESRDCITGQRDPQLWPGELIDLLPGLAVLSLTMPYGYAFN
jgi:hypothetical protein